EHSAMPHLAQEKALEFSAWRSGQSVDEHDPPRVLPRPKRSLHMDLELLVQRLIGITRSTVAKHHKCLRLDQAVGILCGHDSGFDHHRMAGQCLLDLERR